jgi:hypothetical protein
VNHDQQIADLVLRFYRDAWNRWDDTAVGELLTDDFVLRGSLGDEVRGREGFRTYRDKVRAASPDFHNDVGELIAGTVQRCDSCAQVGTSANCLGSSQPGSLSLTRRLRSSAPATRDSARPGSSATSIAYARSWPRDWTSITPASSMPGTPEDGASLAAARGKRTSLQPASPDVLPRTSRDNEAD